MSMFPMYIAVSHEPSASQGQGQSQEPKFKLYQNTIYNRPNSSPINVLWPIAHVRGARQTIRLTDSTREYSSVTRSWNGTDINSIKWSFTGSSIYVHLEKYGLLITAPIVFMDVMNKMILPYNSSSFSPNEIKFIDEQDITYTSARVFRTDPNSPENTSPIPGISQDRILIRPTAPPAAIAHLAPTAPPAAIAPFIPIAHLAPTAPPAAPVMYASVKQSTLPSLPPHITKIVLADAIRKNDACPITSEDISETNATVTSCGHVFTTAAITHWLTLPSSKGLCPVCKQKCT
jgi:hypothetical protein